MFHGAFGPIVKLDRNGIRPAQPKNVPGADQQSISVNDAVPSNALYQPTGG